MPVISTPSGRMSVRKIRKGDKVVSSSNPSAKAGAITRANEQMSTRETPTPSAEQLRGTTEDRERQIAAFRSGGQVSFEAERARAEARIQAEQGAGETRAEALIEKQVEEKYGEAQRITKDGVLVGFGVSGGRVDLTRPISDFFTLGDQLFVDDDKEDFQLGGRPSTDTFQEVTELGPSGFVSTRGEDPFGVKPVIETGGAVFKPSEISTPIERGGEVVGFDTGFMSIGIEPAKEVSLIVEGATVRAKTGFEKFVGFAFTPPGKSFAQPKGDTIGEICRDIPRAVAEDVKFITTKPFAIVSEQFRGGGREIRKQDFRGSQVLGTVVGGTGELIPETPGGVAFLFGGLKVLSLAPTFIRTGAGLGFGVLGTKTALDPTLTAEERFAGGVIGGLGFTGATFEALPFVRGAGAQTIGRIKGEFKPTRMQETGFRAVEDVTLKDVKVDIGIIESGSPKAFVEGLPPTSPLRRGGFGVKEFEKPQFLGGPQDVATSQIGLVSKPGQKIPIEREFFITPQEPTLKIPITRESRLGLQDFFKIPKQTEFGFGPPGKPQILIESGAFVTKTGKKGSFEIGKGTELEATKTEFDLEVGEKLGVTTIKGQAVDIFEIKTTPSRSPKGMRKPPKTTEGITRIQTESILGTTTSLTKMSRSITKGLTFKSPPKTTRGFTDIISPVSPPISPPIFSPMSPPRSPPPTTYTTPPPSSYYGDLSDFFVSPIVTTQNIFGTPTKRKKQKIFKLGDFPKGTEPLPKIFRAKRKFQPTGSFGQVLLKDFGIEGLQKDYSKALRETGLVERKLRYKKIKPLGPYLISSKKRKGKKRKK